jgi:hypothetical protein
MPNTIQANFGSSTALTITLTSLASSAFGVGRQSNLVDNTIDLGQMIRVYFKVTTGTSPTNNRTINFYFITADAPTSPNIITDGAGTTDAGLTVQSAPLVHSITTLDTSDKTYQGSFLIRNPGKAWAICVVHDTGVALNATGSNHLLRYIYENQVV